MPISGPMAVEGAGNVSELEVENINEIDMAPYSSEKQRRYLHAKHPEIAKRWDAEAKGKVVGKTHKAKVRSAAKKAFGGKY